MTALQFKIIGYESANNNHIFTVNLLNYTSDSYDFIGQFSSSDTEISRILTVTYEHDFSSYIQNGTVQLQIIATKPGNVNYDSFFNLIELRYLPIPTSNLGVTVIFLIIVAIIAAIIGAIVVDKKR